MNLPLLCHFRNTSLPLLHHPPLTVLNFVQKDMNAHRILPRFVMHNYDFTLIRELLTSGSSFLCFAFFYWRSSDISCQEGRKHLTDLTRVFLTDTTFFTHSIEFRTSGQSFPADLYFSTENSPPNNLMYY